MKDDDELPIPPGLAAGLTREERIEEFLRLLATGCTVTDAANAVALIPTSLHRHRRRDPVFAKAWEDAQRISVKQLIAEAERRAMRGSDKMLIFMLTNYAPDKFRKASTLEVTNPDGSLSMSTEQRAAAIKGLLEKAKAAKAHADGDDLI